MAGEIINRISELAGKKRLKPADLAKAAGISWETATRLWEDGTTSITFKTMAGLCRVLECQPGDLFQYRADESKSEADKRDMK